MRHEKGKHGMTDWQFKTILEMVNMILEGCQDLDEAKAKVRRLIASQTTKSERTPEEET